MPILCECDRHQRARVAARWGGCYVGRWVIILLHKPLALRLPPVTDWERERWDLRKQEARELRKLDQILGKMGPKLESTSTRPLVTFHSLPPTARDSAPRVNNLMKNKKGRIWNSAALCTDTPGTFLHTDTRAAAEAVHSDTTDGTGRGVVRVLRCTSSLWELPFQVIYLSVRS